MCLRSEARVGPSAALDGLGEVTQRSAETSRRVDHELASLPASLAFEMAHFLVVPEVKGERGKHRCHRLQPFVRWRPGREEAVAKLARLERAAQPWPHRVPLRAPVVRSPQPPAREAVLLRLAL